MTHPSRPRRPRRLRSAALALGVALLGVLVVGAVSDSFSWRSDMAEAAAVAGEGEVRLGEPVAEGNAACFDVCRRVRVEYRTETTAPETVHRVRDRLAAAGFHDIALDCAENVWCSVHGTRDGLVVSASQYEEEAAYDLDARRVLTVYVGEAD